MLNYDDDLNYVLYMFVVGTKEPLPLVYLFYGKSKQTELSYKFS
jgi:hypothetical protein